MEKIYVQAIREDFKMYYQHIHNTGCEREEKRWKPTRFHKKLCAEVQEFVETDTGHAYDVLLVMCPPQHGKSMTISESLSSWWLGHHPEEKVIVGCYTFYFYPVLRLLLVSNSK